MAIEDIFKALEEQADRDIIAVTAEAREHAAAILEEAERDAELLRQSRVEEAERHSRARGQQSINTARLEARKAVAAVKEQAVAAAFAKARDALADVRSSAEYDVVFRALVGEAVEGAGGDAAVLVDPLDVELARRVLGEMGLDASNSSAMPVSALRIMRYRPTSS